jgi:hypothetical protein
MKQSDADKSGQPFDEWLVQVDGKVAKKYRLQSLPNA